MGPSVLRVLTAGCAAVAALFLVGPSAAAPNDVGQTAPLLVVRQLDGRDFDLAALRGKVVVINLWATWCVPCRAEMPMLDAFFRQHQQEGLVLIGVSADDVHDRKDVVKAMQGLAYPAALLADARANGFGSAKVLPITYVIGPEGTIRAKLMPTRGGLTEAELAGRMDLSLDVLHPPTIV